MRSLRTGPARRAVPALERAEPDESSAVLPPRAPRVMVRFTDGSWALCRVGAWQRREGRWIVHLSWGDFGVIREGWFWHEPAMTEVLGGGEDPAPG